MSKYVSVCIGCPYVNDADYEDQSLENRDLKQRIAELERELEEERELRHGLGDGGRAAAQRAVELERERDEARGLAEEMRDDPGHLQILPWK